MRRADTRVVLEFEDDECGYIDSYYGDLRPLAVRRLKTKSDEKKPKLLIVGGKKQMSMEDVTKANKLQIQITKKILENKWDYWLEFFKETPFKHVEKVIMLCIGGKKRIKRYYKNEKKFYKAVLHDVLYYLMNLASETNDLKSYEEFEKKYNIMKDKNIEGVPDKWKKSIEIFCIDNIDCAIRLYHEFDNLIEDEDEEHTTIEESKQEDFNQEEFKPEGLKQDEPKQYEFEQEEFK